LATGDTLSLQQALTLWGTEVGLDTRMPSGWILGLKGFYQASTDITTAGGVATSRYRSIDR
jgi:hypothetical protein